MSLLLPPLLFFIDYSAYILLDAPIVLSLVCFFVLQLFAATQNQITLLITGFFLGLDSFILYGHFGIIYFALLPIILSSFVIKKWLKSSLIVVTGTLSILIILQNTLLGLLLDQKTALKNYTIWQLCVNIGVIVSMSLIICVAGKRDNRL